MKVNLAAALKIGDRRTLVAVVDVRHGRGGQTSNRLVGVAHHDQVGVVFERESLCEPRQVRAADVVRHRCAHRVDAPLRHPLNNEGRVDRLRLGDRARLPIREDDRLVLGEPGIPGKQLEEDAGDKIPRPVVDGGDDPRHIGARLAPERQVGDRLPRLEETVHLLVRDHARDEVPDRQWLELGGFVGRVEHRPEVPVGENSPRAAVACQDVHGVGLSDLAPHRRGQCGDVGAGERPVVVAEAEARPRRATPPPPDRAHPWSRVFHTEHRRVRGDDVGERRRPFGRHVGPEVHEIAEQHELAHRVRVGYDPVERSHEVRLVHRLLVPVRPCIRPDVDVTDHNRKTLRCLHSRTHLNAPCSRRAWSRDLSQLGRRLASS